MYVYDAVVTTDKDKHEQTVLSFWDLNGIAPAGSWTRVRFTYDLDDQGRPVNLKMEELA